FAFTVADVSGKGVPAALFMAITKALLRNHLQGGEDPGKALEKTNRQLCQSNSEGMFVTLWLGVLDTASGRLEYINAGHNPPLLLSAPPPEGPSAAGPSAARRRSAFLTSPPDLVLAALEDTRYRRREIILKPGDTFFLYTDGVNEAADRDGAFYGAERLRAFLEERGTEPPREMLPALFADIGAFTAGAEQSDDITMLALRVAPAPEAAETEACLVPADEAEGDEAEAAEALSALGGSTLFLEARVDQLGELTAFIGGELDRARCPGKIRGQIELAAEEVFVNIARYAYRGEGDRAVTVDFTVDGDGPRRTAVLTFSDRGEPFNPLEQPDPDTAASLEEREPGGLGLLIVKRSMDTVEYRHEGGINRLVLAKSYPAGTAVEEEP
ncbi:MAG: SpoIIE family protein phosphatase, partial [Treponema sp.]|nr:SpoIIE family protein phosphatase [Treponema sp.]